MQEENSSDQKKIIFCSGLGSTGSSAYLNLLQEYKGLKVIDREFRLIVDPCGIIDLRNNLYRDWTYFRGDMALRNFRKLTKSISKKGFGPYSLLNHSKSFPKFDSLIEDYITSLVAVKYRGIWYGIDNIVSRLCKKLGIKHRAFYNSRWMYVANDISKEAFDNLTKLFLESLFFQSDGDEGVAVVEENLLGYFAEELSEMLPHAKILNVIRDPLDVISDSIRVNWYAAPHKVEDYIKLQKVAYKKLIEKEIRYKKLGLYNKNIITVKFEDLIVDYEDVVSVVERFLQLERFEHLGHTNFIPSKSSQNVGIYNKYLNELDITTIRKEFDFFYKYYEY